MTPPLPAIARSLQTFSLYALLLLLPFSKAAVEICFGLLLVGWLAERLHPATRAETIWCAPRLRPLAWAIGAYLGICALSIVVSDSLLLSLRGVIRKWLEYLLYFMMAADVAARPGVARRGLWFVAWSSLGVALYALMQEHHIFKAMITRSAFPPDPSGVYRRMTGPYENPIDLATYLMVVIPLMFGLAWYQRGWRRAALWTLLALLAVCVIRTASLGAVMGLWIGLLVMATATWGLRRVALPFVGASLAAGLLMWWSESRHLMQWFSGVGGGDRWAMWQAAWGMIRDRPLMGHGVNTFMANYLRYWVGGEQAPRYAHNCYLQVAAETGVIGLVSFLGLLGVMFHLIVRGVRRASGSDHVLLIGLLGGLSAFAVHAAVDTNFYSLRQAALFWVLSGIALGMSERTVRAHPELPPSDSVPAAQRPVLVS